MESFLSRVTGKTFPGSNWSPFDEFFGFRKEYYNRRFEFWHQNSSTFSWREFKLIKTNQKKLSKQCVTIKSLIIFNVSDDNEIKY